MMTFGERLRAIRLQRGMTQRQLGDLINTTPVAIRTWETETRAPSMQSIISLSHALQISADELLGINGNFEKVRPFPTSRREAALLENYRLLDNYGMDAVDGVCAIEKRRCEAVANNSMAVQSYTTMIPLFSTPSAAGYSAPIEGEDFTMIPVDNNVPDGADFAVRIQGNSMAPYINDCDIVYVEKSSELNTGDVGIFSIDGSMYCKLYYVDDSGNMTLVSANPDLRASNVFVSAESNITVECCGRVMLKEQVPLPDYFIESIG